MEQNQLAAWLRPGATGDGLAERLAYSLRTRISHWARGHLAWLNACGARVTVRDLYSTPGDTLLTAIVCRHLKQRWPRLRLNCVTKNPDLLENDPYIEQLNGCPGTVVFDFWYLDLQLGKDRQTNILEPTLRPLGFQEVDYRARVFLTETEQITARAQLAPLPRPLIAINTLSAQTVKNWPQASWQQLLPALADRGTVVHLGDHLEPSLPGVVRLAGTLSKRGSLAVVAECALFLGPDSFLMHGANGLDIPSVIIFGGSRTPENLGYPQNVNLFASIACSGCWLTGRPGSECPHALACMDAITPAQVLAAVDQLLLRKKALTSSSRTATQ